MTFDPQQMRTDEIIPSELSALTSTRRLLALQSSNHELSKHKTTHELRVRVRVVSWCFAENTRIYIKLQNIPEPSLLIFIQNDVILGFEITSFWFSNQPGQPSKAQPCQPARPSPGSPAQPSHTEPSPSQPNRASPAQPRQPAQPRPASQSSPAEPSAGQPSPASPA